MVTRLLHEQKIVGSIPTPAIMVSKYKMTRIDSILMCLHKYVWEQTYGKIPKGMLIHHKNGDRYDNRLENLVMMTCKEHAHIHVVKSITHGTVCGYKHKGCRCDECTKAILKKNAIWKNKNKDKVQGYNRLCYLKNKEKYKKRRSEYWKEYYLKNREKINEYQKEYRVKNREQINERRRVCRPATCP